MYRIAILAIILAAASAQLSGKCSDGGCCDLKTHLLRPKGYECITNPCYMPNKCTGENPYCPTGGVQRPNGTVCPEGVCWAGKCKQATKCVGECCDKEGRALIEGAPCTGGACDDGICRPVPVCMGECCNEKGKAKEDGTECKEGNCMTGMCVNLDKRCTDGKCCNQYTGLMRPKGFRCTNNPCASKMECTGLSAQCPTPTHFKVDGTPCPKGVCMAGVCGANPNATVAVDPSTGKLVQIAPPGGKKEEKKKTGDSIEIHHHFVSTPACSTGPCCDVHEKKVMDDGMACANKTCFIGVCDGRSSGCAYATAPAGTPCEDGRCYEGQCIKNCVGQCCRSDGTTPKADGAVCHDGYCFAGYCVRSCKGDCCENVHGVPHAKADGSECNSGNGYCVKGDCKAFTVPVFKPNRNINPAVVPSDSDKRLFEQSFKESFVKNFFRSAAKVENDEIDEEERKLLERQLNRTKEAEKERRAKEEQAVLNSTLAALQLQASAATSAATSTTTNVWGTLTTGKNLVFFIAGCVVCGVVLIIVIIALAVPAKKKKVDGKKSDDEHGDFDKDYNPPEFEEGDDKKYKF